ncbi:hypothetical protein L2E82_44845 [Cichorium intybus]|uniref:Uncharacterized protein n=1 Tax=Cichorium intybus TaxID=13427 RepID=A0ACB8ZSC9_CICIN|nr:hypothetical protein L2E82_44845 [Cichorium intybus]
MEDGDFMVILCPKQPRTLSIYIDPSILFDSPKPTTQLMLSRSKYELVFHYEFLVLAWLEHAVHGRGRNVDSLDETYFGVHEELLYARKTKSVEGAQWTVIVTTIAIEMLKSGMVEVVVCIQSDPDDILSPIPVLARTPEEAASVKRLVFCGVGCQVQD